jgi:hypothetical protein
MSSNHTQGAVLFEQGIVSVLTYPDRVTLRQVLVSSLPYADEELQHPGLCLHTAAAMSSSGQRTRKDPAIAGTAVVSGHSSYI